MEEISLRLRMIMMKASESRGGVVTLVQLNHTLQTRDHFQQTENLFATQSNRCSSFAPFKVRILVD